MTIALCLNCGETKFGALCPCLKCGAPATGHMKVDIAFSSNYLRSEALDQLGAVVVALRAASEDSDLRLAALLHYTSENYPKILHIEFKPEALSQINELLERAQLPPLPPLNVREPRRRRLLPPKEHEVERYDIQRDGSDQRQAEKPWWKFW